MCKANNFAMVIISFVHFIKCFSVKTKQKSQLLHYIEGELMSMIFQIMQHKKITKLEYPYSKIGSTTAKLKKQPTMEGDRRIFA